MADDVGDGKGISTGSAIACKQACQASRICKFWSYKDGWARDCYLKRGRRGDPNPTGAVPKIGYVSGTKGKHKNSQTMEQLTLITCINYAIFTERGT